MEFKKLNAPSLRELFVNELQNMILSGKLEIGSKLPPERELAESMKVSRAVINSGIAELEKKGFLVVRPRIGTFVADYRRDGSLDTLVAIMNYNGGVLKNREVKSVLETRSTVHRTKNCWDFRNMSTRWKTVLTRKRRLLSFLSSATRLPTSVATPCSLSFLYRSAILYAVSGSATDKNMAPKNYITVQKKSLTAFSQEIKKQSKISSQPPQWRALTAHAPFIMWISITFIFPKSLCLRGCIYKLALIKICIKSLLGEQFFMASLLNNMSIFHHKDNVRFLNGRQTMSHNKTGTSFHHFRKRFLDPDLGPRING